MGDSSMGVDLRLLAFAATVGLSLTTCQPSQQPPATPPSPTDPTNARIVALHPSDVIDASIVEDAGATIDASVFELDAGASSR
ncbi:MAG: hypothetical protein WBY94_21695 [Polyangiaceae bacterium]